jgi:hypothetical protein
LVTRTSSIAHRCTTGSLGTRDLKVERWNAAVAC